MTVCEVDGCGKQARSRGRCHTHYMQLYRAERHVERTKVERGPCSVEGCERKFYGRNMCKFHWQRWSRYGDPLRTGLRTTEDRLWAQINKDGPLPDGRTLGAGLGPCWLWTGRLNNKGYGRVTLWAKKRGYMAHRMAYEFAVGPIPDGLEIDHLCRNRICCNPSHLEPVTHQENVRRARREVRVR